MNTKNLLRMFLVASLGLGFSQSAVGQNKKADTKSSTKEVKFEWLTNLKEAKKIAKARKLPLVLNFTGSDWCPPCMKLNADIFSKPEFQDLVKGKIVFVKLDFPKGKEIPEDEKTINNEAVKEFEIKGFPTIILLDYEGKKVGQTGYSQSTPTEYAENICNILGIKLAQKTIAEKVAEGLWITNLDEAKKFAKAKKLPLLLNFTGSDWCGWCVKLDNEVFSQAAFKEYVAKKIILVKLDFPKGKEIPADEKKINDAAVAEYKVRGYPSIILLNSRGKETGKMGYMPGGPDAFIKELKKNIKK